LKLQEDGCDSPLFGESLGREARSDLISTAALARCYQTEIDEEPFLTVFLAGRIKRNR